MKRCFSIALILALLGMTAISPAFAEELEIFSEDAEPTVEEVALGDAPEIFDEDSENAPEGTYSDEVEESPAELVVQNASTEDASQDQESQAAVGIQFNVTSLRIGIKEKYTGLTVTALPEGSALPTIRWRSSNKKVAKVSKSGVITGVKKGTTYIYARISGTKDEIKCRVSVRKAPKKVSIAPTKVTLSPGLTYQLKASLPKGYASGKLVYSSSRKGVATVDQNGLVTAVGAGSATVTVKTFNGKKAKCKVKVLDEPASVAFPDTIIPMAVGQTISLGANALTKDGVVTPANITYAIDDSSPDAGCVAVDEATGKITGVRKGQAIIRGTAHNGAVGYCEVDVDVAPAAVSLNVSSATIGVKEVYVGLLPDFTPPEGERTCAQVVTWKSSNKKVAKVDPVTGAVTGVKSGSCTIKAVAPGGAYAKCKIKVLKAPRSGKISISPANGSLKVGQIGQYKITFSKGYGGSLSYESSNPEIATIDNTGVVTAISPGTVTISVITYNGVRKNANLEVIGESSPSESDGSKSGNDEKIQYILKVALQKEGKPYVYGSFGPNSFDCSGFVYWCYKQVNIKLRDSAYKQGYDDRFDKISYDSLKAGDLVFFNTVEDEDLSDHSGLYLGNGKFVHASSSAGKVIISKLSSGYYKRNFSWGRRVFK